MDESFFCIADNPTDYYQCFIKGLKKRNPTEYEFHQAVGDIAESIIPYVFENQKYLKAQILERMTEPDRIISFRVCWEDDDKNVRTNRGYRVQFNNSIGPYKGGLRFHPTVNQSILKFLGFEQIFKNSLTGLPIGGAKGGSNFNPKGKSDREIMRFCQSFMTELYKHLGENRDIPAGDIGVGSREISYLYGQYKRLTNEFTGVLTGKQLEYGGSLIRTEATGYGLVYFAEDALKFHNKGLEGKRCLISGAGNVALYAAEKLLEKKAKVMSLSDSKGFLFFKDGLSSEQLQKIQELKANDGKLQDLDGQSHLEYYEGKKPWSLEADYAFPCATQNEIEKENAQTLLDNGITGIFEGANMPCTAEANHLIVESDVIYGPGKAANAGGVAISALEMSQNSIGMSWGRKKVDEKLKTIMRHIHSTCVEYGQKKDSSKVCYQTGANIGGFVKVAEAMLAYGIN